MKEKNISFKAAATVFGFLALSGCRIDKLIDSPTKSYDLSTGLETTKPLIQKEIPVVIYENRQHETTIMKYCIRTVDPINHSIKPEISCSMRVKKENIEIQI